MTNVNDNQFLNETWLIDQKIDNITKNVISIREIQTRINVAVATAQESTLSQERNQLMYNTKNLLLETKESIKKLTANNKRLERDNPDHPEISVRTQRQEHVKEKFTKALEIYREVETDFMTKQKERMARQYKVVNPGATQTEIDTYLRNPSDQPVFATALLRTGEAKDALEEVQRRHNDIKQIEQTIAELAGLFNELKLQVEIQDETMINIDNRVADTDEKMDHSNKELEKATAKAISSRRKK
ncbi:17328_t:CDS:1, partial [Acaulospora colombiana]